MVYLVISDCFQLFAGSLQQCQLWHIPNILVIEKGGSSVMGVNAFLHAGRETGLKELFRGYLKKGLKEMASQNPGFRYILLKLIAGTLSWPKVGDGVVVQCTHLSPQRRKMPGWVSPFFK